jgi:aldehyde dehydrogenase (NAD+)
MSTFTTAEEFQKIYETLFQTFRSGRTKSLLWRKWQLKQLWWMIEENEDRIADALRKDLNRHTFESYASDIYGIKTDILEHIKHVDEWASDEPLSAAGFVMGTLGNARIRKEPLGVALVIGAWNFPFLLLIQPVIAAVAAGCCVLMKPSELAPASQKLLQDLVSQYLDLSAIALVTGGPSETSHILEQKFDHIFFTGSSKVARFITAAAAKQLTPTVLELGGQGPAIVAESADVDLAAKRIAYAKFLNAGQSRCNDINATEPSDADKSE